MTTRATVTLIGNEGFGIATAAGRKGQEGRETRDEGTRHDPRFAAPAPNGDPRPSDLPNWIYVDAFFGGMRGISTPPDLRAARIAQADLILVTHAHWDHFDAKEVADVARRTGATVVGPATVARALRRALPPEAVVEMEPAPNKHVAAALRARLPEDSQPWHPAHRTPETAITAFRTHHSHDHNSYLVETQDFRFFHDGDNEDTRPLDPAALGRLDALFIGPWLGSGWVEFVEKLAPAHWFLMHLSDEELAQHEAGRYLPDLCDRVPPRLVVLRPGESFAFAGRDAD